MQQVYYIIGLTGITQEDIDTKGRPFAETWPEFRDFIGGDASVICCNGYDPKVLTENCEINDIDDAMEDLNFHSLRPMIVEALGAGAEPPVSAELARLFASRTHTGVTPPSVTAAPSSMCYAICKACVRAQP